MLLPSIARKAYSSRLLRAKPETRKREYSCMLGNIETHSAAREHTAKLRQSPADSYTRGNIQIHLCMLGNTRQQSHTLKRKQKTSDTLEHAEPHSDTLQYLRHTRQHSNTLQYSGLHSHVFGNIQANSSTREHAGTHMNIHDNIRMHSKTSGTLARSLTH